jgi:hypothetical protein
MFMLMSDKLGWKGSLLVSVVVTVLLWMACWKGTIRP